MHTGVDLERGGGVTDGPFHRIVADGVSGISVQILIWMARIRRRRGEKHFAAHLVGIGHRLRGRYLAS